MADDLDRAADYQQQMTDAALSMRREAPRLAATGECHWCAAPAPAPKRFCDSRCTQDWERFRENQR